MKVINIVLIIVMGFFITPNASASLILDVREVDGNQQLFGINNFEVGGELFNIEFIDGTCAETFDPCGGSDGFGAFTSGLALEDFVPALAAFLNNAQTTTTPLSTLTGGTINPIQLLSPIFFNGCDLGITTCFILFPTQAVNTSVISGGVTTLISGGAVAASLAGAAPIVDATLIDQTDPFGPTAQQFNTDTLQLATFGRVSIAPSISVPEPSMISLLALGLLGMAVRRKRVR